MTPTVNDSSHRRASCDQCRQKKLKCDGEFPACGRCMHIGDACKYSARLPLGRPKKRKVQEEEDHPSSANKTTETSPSSGEKDSPNEIRPETDVNTNQFGFEFTPQLSYDPGVDQNLWGCETNFSIESDPTMLGLESISSKTSCSCLASIYLCLEETRATDTTSFSSGLIQLRSVIARALGILQCQVCPTNFVWAMQNSQLLNTLLVSIAETYRKLVQSIEEEAQRAANNSESKVLFISETQPSFPDLGPADGNFSSPFLHLSMTAQQWEAMAKNAIREEIFGSANTTSATFARLLQLMENRQRGWHSGALPSCLGQDRHYLHRHSADKEPFCVTLVKHTKAIIDRLQLNT